MKKIFYIILFFISYLCSAQNLVNNWSFEDTVGCPTTINQIIKASGWSSFRLTPDYFNSCNNTIVSVPQNNFGYQYPLTGEAYAGMTTFAKYTNNFREIIGTQLLQPLIIGQKYFLSFYVSNPFDSVTQQHGATNKTGAKFLTSAYSQINPISINNFAHIYSDSLIIDSINWVKIAGSFIADSAYQYMAIGNFFADSVCTHILYDSAAAFAYYYIDDVRLSTDSNFVNGVKGQIISRTYKIFPNPARDWIVLEGKGIKSVAILNALGSEIGYYPTTASTLLHKINCGLLSRGIYFLKINMINDTFHFQKIIVQ